MTTATPSRVSTPALKLSASSTPAPTSKSGDKPGPQERRRSARPGQPDPLSNQATQALIRRVLCPQEFGDKGRAATPAPVEELLPPLTSRNDVDLQLYALLAIILREYVQAWYGKLTPDETFVAEIIQIVAHCTRALEQRLRKVDLESLLFDEIPDLLDRHVQAYRTAHQPMSRPPIENDARDVYHAICPLPYLSPVPRPDLPATCDEQAANEAAYRQLLVQGVLAVLLPTEDLENSCLTALVGQLFSETIIGGIIARKLAEPWLIWEGLIILSRVIRQKTVVKGDNYDQSQSRVAPASSLRRWGASTSGVFWFVVRAVFAAYSLLGLLVSAILLARALPPKRTHTVASWQSLLHVERAEMLENPQLDSTEPREVNKVPVVAFRIWATISNLMELSMRMPWACGALSMTQWLAMTGPGKIAGPDGVLDRLLSRTIHERFLDPSALPPLLRSLRGALFPNNAPGTSSLFPPSSESARLALKRRCAKALLELLPSGVGVRFFAGTTSRSGSADGQRGASAVADSARRVDVAAGVVHSDNMDDLGATKAEHDTGGNVAKSSPQDCALAEIEAGILDVFEDIYLNKHLMYSILELLLVRLMPELAERGVAELWEERLSR